MNYTDTASAVQALREVEGRLYAFSYAMSIIGTDAVTVAPKGSTEGRGRALGVLNSMVYSIIAEPSLQELLDYLKAHEDELEPQIRREAQELRKNRERMSRIPEAEYVEYSMLLNEAGSVWEKAKNENDFAAFCPYLEKIMDFCRKFAGYYNPDMPAYDALLNEYEEGLTTETCDAFFRQLRTDLVPLIEKVGKAKQVDYDFMFLDYPIDKQREFSDYLMDAIGLDREHCVIGETEHPFTSGTDNHDVRITTHYHRDMLDSSMYSVIHEGGHALYELGCDDKYNYTVLAGGAAMSIHESQSRFYENIIGRSEAFIDHIFPKVKEIFPEQLKDVDAKKFYLAVNRVNPSLIRTQADELTYCMHVMVRYELEKRLIGGTLKAADVPAEWNKLYKEYLGVDVPSDREGCLQDSHWSGGLVGYFPSYALGSAYGAQMLSVMKQDLGDIFADVAKGDLSRVTAWLKEHIHRHASMYRPGELFEKVCGKFDAKYYTDYLTEKYTKIYDL